MWRIGYRACIYVVVGMWGMEPWFVGVWASRTVEVKRHKRKITMYLCCSPRNVFCIYLYTTALSRISFKLIQRFCFWPLSILCEPVRILKPQWLSVRLHCVEIRSAHILLFHPDSHGSSNIFLLSGAFLSQFSIW